MPSPRPLVPPSAAQLSGGGSSLLVNKAPQPPVTIDLTAFQQLQQQLHNQQQQHRIGPPAMPLSASNSASASVTLSQPLPSWASKAAGETQVSNNIQTLVQSFNRHATHATPSFAQPVSFSAPSPPPQLHSLVPQSNNHSLSSSPGADRPPSEVSYSALYYPQSPPASALHTLSSGFHQPASPLLSSTTYWPIQYDPSSGQQQQYVLKMNGSNIVIPAPIAVAAQQPSQLVKQESGSMMDHSQQSAGTPGRHSACAVCHSAKTSCNGQRPCDRCIRLDRQSMCIDRPRKTPVRSDKKKGGAKEEGEQAKDTDKAKKVKGKREHDNGAEDAGNKRIKGEEGVEEGSGKVRGDVVKKELPSLVPPSNSTKIESPSAVRRDVSAHSSHSSSDSVSAASPSSSSPASPSDELIDVATSSSLAALASASSEPERRLSTTYLRMHQVYPTRGAIADAIRNGAVTPLQVHFLLSYLNAVLHTDDFKQLLQPLQSSSTPSSLVSPSRGLSSSSLPSDLVSDRGVYIPRFHFNFGCSPLEPVDDNNDGLIDFATLQIVRVDAADINTTMDSSTLSGAAGFGLLDSNGRPKASSPSPPAIPFATSSTSAFTVVPSTSSATSSPLPSPNSSSLSSSLSPAKASSPVASLSSPLSPPSSLTTAGTAADNIMPSADTSTTSPSASSAILPASESSPSSTSPSFATSSLSSIFSSSASEPSTSLASLSGLSSSSSSSPVNSDVFLTIRVNREFERLFGYSQPYMRDLFRSEGGKVLYRLLSNPSMPVLSKWLTEGLIGERTEFKAVVTIINRYKGTTECLLNCRWTLDSGGLFRSVAYCFAPLPEKGLGGGRWMKGDV